MHRVLADVIGVRDVRFRIIDKIAPFNVVELQRISAGTNVRDEGQWQSVVAETLRRFGMLNALVNNAGSAGAHPNVR